MVVEFGILEESDIETIHSNSLRLLEEAGMKVDDEGLCQVLQRKGLPVDEGLIRLPADIVMEALSTAPHEFSLYSQSGEELCLRPGHLYPETYQNALRVLDYGTSSLRPATEQDLTNFVRLGDAIPEIKIVGPVCWPQDLPSSVQALHAVATLMCNTTKHTSGGAQNLEEAQIWVELAQIASESNDLGRQPTVHLVVSPTSPLQLDADSAQVLLYLANKGVPVCVSSCPMAGATSPFTLAGTLMLAHAEQLFLLTAAQLIREGTPVIMGGAAGLMDMRSGKLSYGCPERHLILGAAIELANHYGLPHLSPSGSVDAWWPDVQCGAEKMLTWVTRLIKGVVLGIYFGSLATGAAVSLEQIVIDADLFKTAQRLFQGLQVNEDTLALEVVQRVGHGGNFLIDEHTLRWMRSGEHYFSAVVNRDGDQGADMVERAHGEVQKLLQGHQTSVSDETIEEIQRYATDRTRSILS